MGKPAVLDEDRSQTRVMTVPVCSPKLRKSRLKAQFSQNQLARKASLDRQTVRNAERGLEISELTLEKLTAALRTALNQEDLTITEISTEA
jgi:DNA-binding XRE family transcriptional regulator